MVNMTRIFGNSLKKTCLVAFIAVVFCCIGVPQSAFAVPGDFDGDGTSDMSVGLVGGDRARNIGATAWLTRPTNGGTPLFWTWTVPADAYVSGRFYVNDSRYYPGVVWVRDSNSPLEWYIKNAANQDVVLQYGLPGDSITNLGDWDGDGRDDIAVVRVGDGDYLHWYVAQSASGQIVDYVFGLKGDKPFVSDCDGDGKAEIIVLRNTASEQFNWYIMNPEVQTFFEGFGPIQWGLPGDLPLVPQDLDGDHLPDLIVTRKTGTLQIAYIRYGNGKVDSSISLGFDTSVPQIGNFSGGLGFAWTQRDSGWNAVRDSVGGMTFFQLGIASNAIIRADGTVVQPTENGTYPEATTQTETVKETTNDTSGDNSSVPCKTVYRSGWLLKPASQDSGGSRQGKPLILFTSRYPQSGCLNIVATDGTVVAHYGKFSSNRFYSGWGCGEAYSGSKIASLAVAATGSKNIYVQDPATGACYGPGPADGRTDHR